MQLFTYPEVSTTSFLPKTILQSCIYRPIYGSSKLKFTVIRIGLLLSILTIYQGNIYRVLKCCFAFPIVSTYHNTNAPFSPITDGISWTELTLKNSVISLSILYPPPYEALRPFKVPNNGLPSVCRLPLARAKQSQKKWLRVSTFLFAASAMRIVQILVDLAQEVNLRNLGSAATKQSE